MLQIVGIAFATLICYIFLEEKAPQFALIITIAGCCIIFGITSIQLKAIGSEVEELISTIPESIGYVSLMIKVLLITILTQITSDLCRDNGQSSLASILELSAKIIIASMSLPLLKSILNLILGLVK